MPTRPVIFVVTHVPAMNWYSYKVALPRASVTVVPFAPYENVYFSRPEARHRPSPSFMSPITGSPREGL